MDFGLNFCDAQELRESWKNTLMPDELITFFSTLFNVNQASLRPNYHKENVSTDEDIESFDEAYDEADKNTKQSQILHTAKIMSLYQVMCYNIHHGRMKTPLHVMNAHAIYEKCRSRQLLTSFNRTGLCVSYKQIKKYRTDLAKYAVLQSEKHGVPIPSHLSTKEFTLAAMDNFDHPDKTSLAGLSGTHDTAMTLFQVIEIISYFPHQPLVLSLKCDLGYR